MKVAWSPNPIQLLSLRKREIWTQTCTQGGHHVDINMAPTSQVKKYQMEHRSQRSGETNPTNTLISDFQNYKKINFCCLSYPVSGTFLQQSQQINTEAVFKFCLPPKIFKLSLSSFFHHGIFVYYFLCLHYSSSHHNTH